MPNLGKGIYDDQGKVSASLIPNVKGLDIGSVEAPFRTLYVENSVGGVDLANNVYLKARNFADSAYLDLLKADASNNTVVNALTGKSILFDINHITVWSITPTGGLLGDATGGDIDNLGGGLNVSKIGSGVSIVSGANAKAGTFVANGATPVSVATTAFVAGSAVLISLKTVGGTVGALPHLATATPATGFTVVGTALDTSTYNWVIIDQA